MRAPLQGSGTGDIANDAACGFAIVTARDLDRYSVDGVIEKIRKRVMGKVYISVDIDVLDPAYAVSMVQLHSLRANADILQSPVQEPRNLEAGPLASYYQFLMGFRSVIVTLQRILTELLLVIKASM